MPGLILRFDPSPSGGAHTSSCNTYGDGENEIHCSYLHTTVDGVDSQSVGECWLFTDGIAVPEPVVDLAFFTIAVMVIAVSAWRRR